MHLGATAAILMATLAVSAPAMATPTLTHIDSSACYGAFCLTMRGTVLYGSTPDGHRLIVENSVAVATFYDDAGDLVWTDEARVNQHYRIGEDGTVEQQTQRYHEVMFYDDGSKYCYGYVTVVRDNELIVQNVHECGGSA
jgi:hypothetical protein